VIRPVVVNSRCIGHIFRTARGYVAYDRTDTPIGTYATEKEAADALAALDA
jgi:hypothetical protein